MFMSAKIKPLVDGTIRRVLLNKPWYFNLERSVSVLCESQCKAVLAMPVKKEKQ